MSSRPGPPVAQRLRFVAVLVLATGATSARAEVILQYFETPWAEIEARMPEVAAAGYDVLWLPPPTKGTEGERDVGFAVFDRFDLGDTHQRGTTPTRYGTKAELQSMVRNAHRFGVRVVFDVVMNHNGNPNGIENVGVSLQPVDLDGFPGTSVWDYHVLPARVPSGDCAGRSGCDFCAWQPSFAVDDDFNGAAFDGKQSRVLNLDGSTIGGGFQVCAQPEGDEGRVAAMTIAEAMLDDGAPSDEPSVFSGYTHVVRAPRMGNFDDFGFEVSNWALLGLFDLATEQYEDGSGPKPIDGTNAVIGTPLPTFVRDEARPATYEYEIDPNPHAEDIREYLMRWIRWLMLETRADGFRLDAIKHIWPNFYGSDFAGDEVAFITVMQDTYDEMHGFNDEDDADLVDDAAVFGEDFTGSCGALKPYILTGMRTLDFPLFFNSGDLMFGGDIRKYSGPLAGDCSDGAVGAFMGLNRRSGVSFAQSHDECQKNETADTDKLSSTFSRCNASGAGHADLVYAYILTREADATVFFDGNRWTPRSFVRSGRPDGLVEVAAGTRLDTLPTLVTAARRMARGRQENRWVFPGDDNAARDDGYAYERVTSAGPAGLVVLNDGGEGDLSWGDGSSTGSFIVTTFLPGTELCELTGNALAFAAGCHDVLDPAALAPGEQPEVDAARVAFQTGTGAPAPDGHGVLFTGVPAGRAVIYAPPALRLPTGGGDDVVEVLDIDVADLAPGVHALHVRFRRAVAGAADAQDEVIVPLCVPSAGDADVCGASTAGDPPAADPLVTGLVELRVDGETARRLAVQTAPVRALPDGRAVAAAKVFYVLIDGDALDVVVHTDAALAVNDIGARIDDVPFSVPGSLLDGTAERFLDGFTKLFPTGVMPPDSGVLAEGEGEPDAGAVDSGGDDDADGVNNGLDNCVASGNPAQEDFDEDRVGDACDLCVLEGSTAEESVDATGCRPLSVGERASIMQIARAIALRQPPRDATDVDGDGVVNVFDLDKAIAHAHQ